jgi:Ca2+-dependent lipid-binding protein
MNLFSNHESQKVSDRSLKISFETYICNMGVVTVTLLKILNLKDKDGVGKSDPYVKLELVKDRIGFDKKYGKYVCYLE